MVAAAEKRRREAEERAVAREEATARIREAIDREEHARKEILEVLRKEVLVGLEATSIVGGSGARVTECALGVEARESQC